MNGQKNTDKEKYVSAATIKRLPRYYRYLRDLLDKGITKVSSATLATLMNVTASQIRQDLNCFGDFGQQGYGYNVEYLYNEISDLLGVNESFNAVIIGAGNLGRALVRSPMFARRGVKPVAMFDVEWSIVGSNISGIPVLHTSSLAKFCNERDVHIGVLTLPKQHAEAAMKSLIDAGVKGIWNFTSCEPEELKNQAIVENVHLGDSLMTLCFRMRDAANGTIESNEDESES